MKQIKEPRRRTILQKLLFSFGGLSLCLFLLFGGSILYVTSKSFTQITETMTLQLADSRGGEITRWLEGLHNEVKGFAELSVIKNSVMKEAGVYLEGRNKTLNPDFAMVFISDTEGNYHSSLGDNGNIGSRDYFIAIKDGQSDFQISNPVISISMGIPIFVIAQKVEDSNGDFIGIVAATVKLTTLADISASVKLGESGFGFILDGTGSVIAHPDSEIIMKAPGTEEYILNLSGLEQLLADLSENGIRGEITDNTGSPLVVFLKSVRNTPGWILGITISRQEYMRTINDTIRLILIMTAASITILVITVVKFAISFSKTIKEAAAVAIEIARGDLTVRIDNSLLKKSDEVGDLARALDEMVTGLRNSLIDIQTTSEQIRQGSDSISMTSQLLSEGATEQAATSQDVSESMQKMSESINSNSENTELTESIANKVAHSANEGGKAVEETIRYSQKISEKINVISEIARQTNLLALNAAIEAARAGDAGQGFAVVASEVRKLAVSSQKSATEIISETTDSLKIAREAGRILLELVVPQIQNTAELTSEVKAATQEQRMESEQISRALSQLDSVIQQNAASSEELAAMAEEFTAQAITLKDTVARFKT